MASTDDLQAVEDRPRHAGLGVRIGAALLDVVTMGVPVLLLVYILAQVFGITDGGSLLTVERDEAGTLKNVGFGSSFETWAQVLVLAVATILFWVNWDGRTPGKKLLKIRIVSFPEYQEFGYGPATIRSIVGAVSALTVIPYVVIAIMVAAREDRRGFHDLWAKTVVVHERA